MGSAPATFAHTAEHENDPYGEQDGYIKATDFSLPYYSEFSRIYGQTVSRGLLRHVNCGYLSTEGIAPTLLALKQHAQSLCILIHQLNPTTGLTEIGDGSLKRARAGGSAPGDPLALKAHLNDAFDFLSDLSTPYTNDDANHQVPLTALLNEVRARDEIKGVSYHCPFADAPKPRNPGDNLKPYATHQNLVMHANACLERLDHEFSTTGGLLSILPTDEEGRETMNHARNTLLGQWLVFTQHLVGRMHELERSYNNALDALASEAVIPAQHLSIVGPTAASEGHNIVYPQDKYVLVNAGDDIFQYLHSILDKQETLVQANETINKKNGVIGEISIVEDEESQMYTKGIVYVDIPSRFYRLAGQGRNTLFVLPAHNVHPATAHTRLLESQPTVVTSISATNPERISVLERRFSERIVKAEQDAVDVHRLRAANEKMEKELKTFIAEQKKLVQTRDEFLRSLDAKGRVKVKNMFQKQESIEHLQTQLKKARENEQKAKEELQKTKEEITQVKAQSEQLKGFCHKWSKYAEDLAKTKQQPTPTATSSARKPETIPEGSSDEGAIL
ncbi:hypothetical protein QBC41DRAFT_119108 [Cercophora samala]|uniref:Uncharacterized protein n=1 Tax=Cercophora samala TaxID=330535 RepID=A0AA40DCJ7_9PEZI|nr:hypothetical protein QBC41DRAFT_119108 [Cercophora samala]